MLEAIEKSYERFNSKISNVPDMDKLIEATDELTEGMVERFFIHEK